MTDEEHQDELRRRAEQLHAALACCEICPRRCRVNRLQGETGFCNTGERARLASAGPHYGEEDVLVGRGGSGTLFFGGCNLGCVFCQNADISHGSAGRAVSPRELAAAMLGLQERGCHNINFVTPTHVTPQLMAAILIARSGGLSVPVVYNCGGYEKLETLQALEGFVDVYMPDAKYADAEVARRLSAAPDYPEAMFTALREMHRQVGDLVTDDSGIATRGLLVRHLVLPNGLAGSRTILDFVAEQLSPDTYVNVMPQYRPSYRAHEYCDIARPATRAEFSEAYDYARGLGLRLAR
jgi:putative pyruvate formate lyase activating enzyme